MFCMKCGRQMPDTAKFCTGCGAPMYKEVPRPQPEPGPAASKPDGKAADRPKKSHKGLIAAIVILLVLAAAGGGAAWYFLGGHAGSGQETVQAAATEAPAAEAPADEEEKEEPADEAAPPTAEPATPTPAPTPTPVPVFGNLDGGQSGEYEMAYAARVDGVILSVPNITGSDLDHMEAATVADDGTLTTSSAILPGDYHSLVTYQHGVAAVQWDATASLVWVDPNTMEKTVLFEPGQDVYLGNALCVFDDVLYFIQSSDGVHQICHMDEERGLVVDFTLSEDVQLQAVTDRGVYLDVWDSNVSAYQIRLYSLTGEMLHDYAGAAAGFGADGPVSFLRQTQAGLYLLAGSGSGGQPLILREEPDGTLTNVSQTLAEQGVAPAGDNTRFMDACDGELYILCPEDEAGGTGIYRVDEDDFSAQRVAGLQITGDSGSYLMGELYAVSRGQFLVRTYDLFSGQSAWQYVTDQSAATTTSTAPAAPDAAEAVSPSSRPRGAVYGGSGLPWSNAALVGDVVMTTVNDISDGVSIRSYLDVQRLNEDGTWSPIAAVDGFFTCLIPWNGVICGMETTDGVCAVTAIDPETMVKKVLYPLPEGQDPVSTLGVGGGRLYFSVADESATYVCHLEPDGTMVQDFPLDRDKSEYLQTATDSGLFISSSDQSGQNRALRLTGFDGQTRMEFSPEIGTDFLAETDLRVYTTLSDDAGNYRVMGQNKQTGEVVDVTAALTAQGLDFSGPRPSWDVGSGVLYLLMPENPTTACFVYKIDEQTLQAEDLLQNSIRGGDGSYWLTTLYVITEERVIIRHENQDTFGTILSYY